jgi:two-component system response regulator
MVKILLVDDNEDNLEILERWLTRRDYEIAVAMDGQQAVTRARDELPDLIVMDMNLPVLDGWTATSQIKSDVHLKHIPIIGLSAYNQQMDRDQAMAAGCDAYEVKPVDSEQLLSTITLLLGKKG